MKDVYGFDVSPELRRTLGHAAMGTAGGALIGGATADPEHRVRGALQGGAIGGLAAGGISHLSGGELARAGEQAASAQAQSALDLAQAQTRHRNDLNSILNNQHMEGRPAAEQLMNAKLIAMQRLPKLGFDTYGFTKQASYDLYGFSTKEALAAPGLLGQMGSAISRMGKATGIAAQRAGNAFQAERNMSKLTGGQLPNAGLGRSMLSAGQAGAESLMKSQAGRRVIGTGIGLGAAGTLAAGTAAYNATQPKPPVALAR